MKFNLLFVLSFLFLILINAAFVYGVVFNDDNESLSVVRDFESVNNQFIYSKDGIVEQNIIRNANGINVNAGTSGDFNGYIVEFEKEPLTKKKAEFNQRAETNKEAFLGKVPIVKNFITTPENVESKYQNYKEDLENDHDSVKAKVLGEVVNTNNANGITGNAVSEEEAEDKVLADYTKVFNGIALNINSEKAKEIEKVKGVKRVVPNTKVNISLMDSVPLINADDVWLLDADGNNCSESGKECLTGKGISIAIIDTGVDYTHPDLGGCFGEGCKVVGGYDFVNNDENPMDDHGHGTHVAATAAGKNYGTGLNGVAPDADVYAYKVLNSGGSGFWEGVMAGIERAVDPNNDGNFEDHVDIISMSLGGYGDPDDPVSTSVDNAVDAGVVSVIAAGNSGPYEETIGSPGTARKAITVGATYKKDYEGNYWMDVNPREDQITSFSSRGPVIWKDLERKEKAIIKPDIVAPGALICASRYDSIFSEGEHPYYFPCYDDKHVQLAGTSMATPIVSGSVALIKQAHPDWTPQEIKAALKGTAVDIGEDIMAQGAGRININEAVKIQGRPLVAEITTSGKFPGITFDVIGIASGENFEKYTLFYSEDSGLNWGEICSSTQQVENSVLCSWSTEDLREKVTYLLKLEVVGGGAVYSEYSLVEIKNTEITSPLNLMIYDSWFDTGKVIWRSDEPIEIYGTASGKNFVSYTLEWCDEYGVCSQEGMDYSGGEKVENGLLGILNTPESIKSGFYDLRLINRYNGNEQVDWIRIYIETDLQEGWPKGYNLEGSGGFALAFMDQPTISDVDNDGEKDLVTAYGTTVSVLDNKGNSLQGWPVEIIRSDFQGAIMQFGPAVGDLDNDGDNEIVVGDSAGYIHIFRKDGSYMVSPKRFGGVVGTPTLSDVNNDKILEIIWSDWHSYLYVVDTNLNLLVGFPKYLSLTSNQKFTISLGSTGSVSVADLNKDDSLELIVENAFCKAQDYGDECANNQFSEIFVLDSSGNVLEGWPFEVPRLIYRDIAIADLNRDGYEEIIFGDSNGSVYALDYHAESLAGWPISIYNLPEGSEEWMKNFNKVHGLSVGDINLDGEAEVVFTGSTIVSENIWGRPWPLDCLFAYSNLGKKLNGFPVCNDWINFKTGFGGIPIIGNIDDDPEMEIVASFGGGWYVNRLVGLYAINHNGSVVKGFPKYLDDAPFGNVAPIGDLDNDGDNELMVGTWRGTTFVYDLKGKTENDDWPMFQHDPQHTGCYNCAENVVDASCYWPPTEGSTTMKTFDGNLLNYDNDGDGNGDYIDERLLCYEGVWYSTVDGWPYFENVIVADENESIIEWNIVNDDSWVKKWERKVESICGNQVVEGNEQCDDGNVISGDGCSEKCEIENIELKCVDSDKFDTSTKGYVDYDNKSYEDYCLVAGGTYKYVTEYYCGFNFWKLSREVKDKVEECEFSCSEGACIDQKEPVYKICNDDDALDKLNVKGNVEFEGKVYEDKCEENSLSVRQYFCVGDKLRNNVKRCPEGTFCSNGVCT